MTHLVMIDCHDLGRHLGCYGWQTVHSPNLDRLAARGVRFANSFCAAPQCSPSRAALYTGRYPHATGMLGLAHAPFSWRLNDDEIHLAAYMQRAGYETVLVGGQHVTRGDPESIRQLGFEQVYMTTDANEIARTATAFLQQSHERPFFLNLGFFETHRDETGGFRRWSPDEAQGVEVPDYLPDTAEARQEFAALQGAVKQLDNAVGAVLSALEAHNLLQDTWVIFTTDHGIAMPRAKCTMYDPGIATTLLMLSQPFGLIGGRVIEDLVSHVDLVPTLLDALDIQPPNTLHGRSYWPLLQSQPYQPREYIFAEKTYHTAYEPQRAIRSTRFKFIANLEVDITNVAADIQHSPIYPQMIDALTQERPPLELYDLEADPLEQRNLADDAAYASVKRDLTAALHQWMQDTADPLLAGPVASPYYHDAMRQLRGIQP